MHMGKRIVHIGFSIMPGFGHPLRVLECIPLGNARRITVPKKLSNCWELHHSVDQCHCTPGLQLQLHPQWSLKILLCLTQLVHHSSVISSSFGPFLSLFHSIYQSFLVDFLAFSLTLSEWVWLISHKLLQVQNHNNKVNKFATIFLSFV